MLNLFMIKARFIKEHKKFEFIYLQTGTYVAILINVPSMCNNSYLLAMLSNTFGIRRFFISNVMILLIQNNF